MKSWQVLAVPPVTDPSLSLTPAWREDRVRKAEDVLKASNTCMSSNGLRTDQAYLDRVSQNQNQYQNQSQKVACLSFSVWVP